MGTFDDILRDNFTLDKTTVVHVGIFGQWLDDIFGHGAKARTVKKEFRQWLKAKGVNVDFRIMINGILQKHVKGLKKNESNVRI